MRHLPSDRRWRHKRENRCLAGVGLAAQDGEQRGMGAYHGIEGFRTLSHSKGIFEQGRWNSMGFLRAPFGRLADTLLSLFLR